jgi:hypothetical protein
MFMARIVASVAYVTLSVARLIAVEMVEPLLAASRQRSVVSVMGIETVVDVPMKAVVAVKPGARSNEDSAYKPVWSIVPIGRAVVGRIVKITVRAYRSYSDVNGDLRLSQGRAA